MHDLGHASLVDAVLGPRAGEVLYATDLNAGHTARHVPYTVAVRMASGVGDDPRVAGDHVGERVAGVGMHPEVALAAMLVARRRTRPCPPRLMVAHHDDRRVGCCGVRL